ncbi:MAG: superoxide dismutase [Deltaproteobacteria bacterium]
MNEEPITMAGHVAKSFDSLLGGKLHGLSDTQLKAHFTLYQGYVKKLNEIWEKLPKADKATANYSYGEYSELRRREPVAYNATFLHELYFENLGPNGSECAPELKQAIEKAFGGFDTWVRDMKAAAASAHGWVVTVWDPHTRSVRNDLIESEHHVGLLVGDQPLLALDVWEHAYFFDYQTKKADYVEAFFKNIAWKPVNERFARWSK